jgi:hypothetical protein
MDNAFCIMNGHEPLGAVDGMLWFKEMCLCVKLAKGGLVMFNLDCQFDYVKKYLAQ